MRNNVSTFKETMIRELAKEGVTHAIVTYFGEGDDGSIENIEAKTSEGVVVKLSPETERVVEDFVYAVLPGGWEINEGSAGTVFIDVIENKVKVEHDEYYQSSHHSEMEY